MPTDFDRYRLQYQPEWRLEMENKIGHGGFGEVYKEQIRRPGMFRSELCAVKKIPLSIANQTGDLQRYKREIAILASLVHHEWFVQFFGWCENKDFVFIAMEYMELGDLGRHLDAPWSESDTKIVAEQLLKGLSVLHRAGIAHRDLKPQNVFPILLHTAIHVPGYTAPETIGMPENYTNAVDIWSLGCLVYRMICGEDLLCSLEDVVYYQLNILSFPRTRLSEQGLGQNEIDFMERLLQGNPQHRPTAEDALSCSWIDAEPLRYKVSSRQAKRFQNRAQLPGYSTLENAETILPQHRGSEKSTLGPSSQASSHSNPTSLAVEIPSHGANSPIAVPLNEHSHTAGPVALSPDGKRLASGSYDDTDRLWDPSTWTCQATLKGHSDDVSSVAFSPDGKRLASGSFDFTVKLWDPSTGACQATLKGHSSLVTSVAFSPDGRCLAFGSFDYTVKLWDPFTEACEATLEGHCMHVYSVTFSPDGKCLASGSTDLTVKLSDPSTGTCQATLEEHYMESYSVAFSPDGKCLASGSLDGTVQLWDLSMGACQGTLEGHSDGVRSVAFSPDGKRLASGSDGYAVKLWGPSYGDK